MKKIELYDYQRDMKERIEKAFISHRSIMVQMPTGTGKTHVLASVVSSCLYQDNNSEVWIIAHRRELVEQIEDTVKLWVDESIQERVKVMSIQWLNKHYQELPTSPSILVIDEAHHALAKTYSEVMNAYPLAKKIGFTATPCRLKKQGFTNLFDELLQSWTINQFIAEGRLSLYDYVSIKPDSEDQKVVDGLQKRGADGDYSLKEMSEKLNVLPSIQRLCHTILTYAKDKKGIVYAIDINHAEHIASYYQQQHLKAVVISSKTPSEERKNMLNDFRLGKIQILVNVDLFGEGFDCPDVEFIQLARPTLSLAKYLQQVGRGMRVFHGKKFCLILDNVGGYRLFGLPSIDRDWQAMFEGRYAGKGNLHQDSYIINRALTAKEESGDERTEMVTLMTHEGQSRILDSLFGYRIKESEEGQQGIIDKDGMEVLPPIYNKVEILPYGFAHLSSRRKADKENPWIDLINGIRFRRQPHIEKRENIDFSTVNGREFYPRVLTRKMEEKHSFSSEYLNFGIKNGVRFDKFLVLPTEPQKLYESIDKMDNMELFEDEKGNCFYSKGEKLSLTPIERKEWDERKKAWQEEVDAFEKKRQWLLKHQSLDKEVKGVLNESGYLNQLSSMVVYKIEQAKQGKLTLYKRVHNKSWSNMGTWLNIEMTKYRLLIAQNSNRKYQFFNVYGEPFKTLKQEYDKIEALDNGFFRIEDEGNTHYLGLETRKWHDSIPRLVRIGFLEFWQEDDCYFVRGKDDFEGYPFRRGEIKEGKGICFLGSKAFVLEGKSAVYHIKQRSLDGRTFIASCWLPGHETPTMVRVYYDGVKLRVTAIK